MENSDNKQIDLFRVFGNLIKGKKSTEKMSFSKNVQVLLKAREDVLNGFKSNLFPTESENTLYSMPRRSKIYAPDLNQIFIDEIKNG